MNLNKSFADLVVKIPNNYWTKFEYSGHSDDPGCPGAHVTKVVGIAATTDTQESLFKRITKFA
jgi:hypothetical protein